MGIVGTGFSMSLDGFIADPHGDVGGLFAWYDDGDITYTYPGGMVVTPSAASAQVIRETVENTGAIVSGRALFDIAKGWGGRHPIDVPVFVVTHEIPRDWDYPNAPFTFVTDGVESAIAQAQAVAGDKNIGLAGANVAQQAIRAGLVDEITVELVPLLLGQGIRFFDHLGEQPIALEQIGLVEAPGVTHLRFRVVK